MRNLLKLPSIGDYPYQQHQDLVKAFLNSHANDSNKSRVVRMIHALNPHEATFLLAVWRIDASDDGIRIDVVIRLLVYSGLRHS